MGSGDMAVVISGATLCGAFWAIFFCQCVVSLLHAKQKKKNDFGHGRNSGHHLHEHAEWNVNIPCYNLIDTFNQEISWSCNPFHYCECVRYMVHSQYPVFIHDTLILYGKHHKCSPKFPSGNPQNQLVSFKCPYHCLTIKYMQ